MAQDHTEVVGSATVPTPTESGGMIVVVVEQGVAALAVVASTGTVEEDNFHPLAMTNRTATVMTGPTMIAVGHPIIAILMVGVTTPGVKCKTTVTINVKAGSGEAATPPRALLQTVPMLCLNSVSMK